MPTFTSSDEIYSTFAGFMRQLAGDPRLAPKFLASKTTFRIHFTDPEAWILVDCTSDPLRVIENAVDQAGEVDLTMSAEDGHQFWLGNLRIASALARKKVKVTGQLPKMMSLLPAMQPAFKLYRQYLLDTGNGDKLDPDQTGTDPRPN
jgi:uncharacterized protein YfaP (DUF2135 family)